MTMTSEEYVANKGLKCPNCQSYNLTKYETVIIQDTIYRDVMCRSCGSKWTNEFRLTSYLNFELGSAGSQADPLDQIIDRVLEEEDEAIDEFVDKFLERFGQLFLNKSLKRGKKHDRE